jgi:hypothetical protein
MADRHKVISLSRAAGFDSRGKQTNEYVEAASQLDDLANQGWEVITVVLDGPSLIAVLKAKASTSA